MTIRLGGIIVGLAITAVLVLWVAGARLHQFRFSAPAPEKQASYAFYEHGEGPEGGFAFDGPLGKWGRCPAAARISGL